MEVGRIEFAPDYKSSDPSIERIMLHPSDPSHNWLHKCFPPQPSECLFCHATEGTPEGADLCPFHVIGGGEASNTTQGASDGITARLRAGTTRGT